MYISQNVSARALAYAVYYIQREASALLVQLRWAYQSLDEWDEHKVQILTLFLFL